MKHLVLGLSLALLTNSAWANAPRNYTINTSQCADLTTGGISTEIVRVDRVCFARVERILEELLIIYTNDRSATVWAIKDQTRVEGTGPATGTASVLNIRLVYAGYMDGNRVIPDGSAFSNGGGRAAPASFHARRTMKSAGRTLRLTGTTPGNLRIDARNFVTVRRPQ